MNQSGTDGVRGRMNVLSSQISIDVMQRGVEGTGHLPIEKWIVDIANQELIMLGFGPVIVLGGQGDSPLEDRFARFGDDIFDLAVHPGDDVEIKI